MIWHYALNGEKRGPVSEDEFHRLVHHRVITGETLVWREGMADWALYNDKISNSPTASAGPGAGVACAGCGRLTPQGDTVEIGGFQYCAACKPKALQRLLGSIDGFNSPAEETRKLHIKHEASIKSVGILYYLGGAALLLAGGTMMIGISSPGSKPETAVGGAVIAVLSVLYFFVGAGIRRLRRWTRIAAGILSGIGLLGFPLGTIINGYILYLLFSQKGATVFSPAYQDVIRQTPHIKYKTSIVVWIVLGLVLFGILSFIGLAVFKH